MAQHHKVGQDRHGDLGVIAVDNLAGVELARAAGTEQLQGVELIALLVVIRGPKNALLSIAPNIHDNIAHRVKYDGLLGRARRTQQLGRDFRHRQAGQVALDANRLDILNVLLEVPWPITRAQHAHALGIALARARFQVQALG